MATKRKAGRARHSTKKDAADGFAGYLASRGLPAGIREHQGIEGRKFRFDIAWPAHRVAVEIHGATYVKGAHSTGRGIDRDCEKANLAQLQGWLYLAFSTVQIRQNPEGALAQIRQALETRTSQGSPNEARCAKRVLDRNAE